MQGFAINVLQLGIKELSCLYHMYEVPLVGLLSFYVHYTYLNNAHCTIMLYVNKFVTDIDTFLED